METRRKVLTVLSALPLVAGRTNSAPSKVLGALTPFPGDSLADAGLRKWLREFDYAEAETQRIVVRGSNGRDDLLPKLAKDLVAQRPDVIIAWGDLAARAAQAATTTIPIVIMTDDLVAAGHVVSLNKPGGNVTGVSVMAIDLDSKRLELLAQLVPPNSTVLLMADDVTPPLSRPGLRRTARTLGLKLTETVVRTPLEMQRAIEGARGRGVAGINVMASAVLFGQIESIIAWVNTARLPAIFEWGFFTDVGALIAYGPLLKPLYRRLIYQAMGLMNGGKVADYPVEQPTNFELAINLKTAKTIGVEIPQLLLLRADRVIR